MNETDDDVFDFARSGVISYPRFNQLYLDILDCQELTRSTGEPHCVAIEGGTGVGKSTLIRAFVDWSLRDVVEDQRKPSAIYVATPAIKHEGAIAMAILEQLGDPFPDNGKVWSQKRRIIDDISALNVDTVCFDDFHHLWDRKRGTPLYDIADYVKMLIKESKKTFVVVGITGEIDRILDANEQLSRLFEVREQFLPFTCNTEEEVKDFAKFIQMAEIQIGMALPEEIDRLDLLGRIHTATNGVANNIFLLLHWSAIYARRDGAHVIRMKDLAIAYDKRLKRRLKKDNPFN